MTQAATMLSKAVIHCDVDCFYCQVEVKDNPSLANRPLAVHQGNSGGFVAVNYQVRPRNTILVTGRSSDKLGSTRRRELLESNVVMGATLTTLLLKLFSALTPRVYNRLSSFA